MRHHVVLPSTGPAPADLHEPDQGAVLLRLRAAARKLQRRIAAPTPTRERGSARILAREDDLATLLRAPARMGGLPAPVSKRARGGCDRRGQRELSLVTNRRVQYRCTD